MKPAPKHTEEITLEPQDIKKIRRQLIPTLLFPFIVIGIFFLIFKFVFRKMGDDMLSDEVVPYVMVGFGIFFMGIIGYMIWTFVHDIRKGIKYRITGIVTDKKLTITKSHSTGKNRSTKTTRHYYVFIDEVKYKMDHATYSKVKVGDNIQLDRAPKSGLTLLLEILEETSTPESQQNAITDQSFISTKLEAEPMIASDLQQLKSQHFSFIQKRLLWNAPLLFIIFSLIYTGMGSLLIFLFPIVIIPAYQFYKVIKATFRYFKNKSEGYKQGITALVEDKLTITSNRTATKYQVKTTAGTLHLAEEAYQRLSNNDKIIIFKPMHGKDPLSVVTMDQKEYFLN